MVELRYLFREYLNYVIVGGVVVVERATSVPLRRVFRYTWMDVT